MPAASSLRVGILAIQGAFREHERILSALGAEVSRVRLAPDLDRLDALVLPGGESTTLQIVLERVGLWEPLRQTVAGGMPTLATCAGMIVLAARITDGTSAQHGMGALDIQVRRNGYGRQLASFEAGLEIPWLSGARFPGVFIRAPVIEDSGSTQVLATLGEHPVAVRQDHVLALTFHPELSADDRLHRAFLTLAAR
ncbi:MAG TPA: pyridoxal 5'-phosphate synthase glutaminase subunit PdxT [Candidatus Nitrosotalea sp.]|nr:pyridoxal 5'-phosphate synthase glutaminase subunit PdxT [Candidatus Nitrosotalea sp.]